MSKLSKRLHQISEGSAQPMGFKTSAAKLGRQMLLVVSLPLGKVDLVRGLKLDDVDAVILHAGDLMDEGSLKRVAGDLQDVPWGVWVGDADSVWLKEFKSVGVDFLVFDSLSAPAWLLQEEGMEKVLKVEPSLGKSLLGAINDLPIDAVLVDVKRAKDLAISDLMGCRRLINLASKPLLAVPQVELSEIEVCSLWEAGVKGLVIEVGGQWLQDVLARQSQSVWKLPAKPRKRKESAALLPRLVPDAGDIDEG